MIVGGGAVYEAGGTSRKGTFNDLCRGPCGSERTNPQHEKRAVAAPLAYGRDSDFDLSVGGIRSPEVRI